MQPPKARSASRRWQWAMLVEASTATGGAADNSRSSGCVTGSRK